MGTILCIWNKLIKMLGDNQIKQTFNILALPLGERKKEIHLPSQEANQLHINPN